LFGIVKQVNQYRGWLELMLFHRQNPTAVLGDENYFSSVSRGSAEQMMDSLVQYEGEGK
jgi:hypothetical protein